MAEHHHCHEENGSCRHHHHHPANNHRLLLRIGVAGLLFAAAVCGLLPEKIAVVLFVGAFLLAGADIVRQAGKNLLRGEWMDENTLMSVATIGALAIGEYPEAAMVMILYQSGEYLQHRAVEKSKRSIAELMDIRPDAAFREENGAPVKHRPEDIAVGDVIIVRSGEKIPLDGTVVEGEAAVDTAALTGESLPRVLKPGSEALSGFINTNGLLKIKVSRVYGESTAAKILKLVENAESRKAKTEKFITRFARYYTPAVVAAAVLVAVLPPLLTDAAFSEWLKRALTFLVISCPCALVISVPLSFFAGIGGASRKGILIKGGSYLEAIARCRTIVFDKTGTLTRGRFAVSRILPVAGVAEEYLLQTAAAAENISNHPIARALRQAAGLSLPATATAGKAEELAGLGVRAKINGKTVLAGNRRLMEKFRINGEFGAVGGTVVHVAEDERYLGAVVIADSPKENAADALGELAALNVGSVMLTGDAQTAAQNIADELKINRFYANLLPDGKVQKLEELMDERSRNPGTVVFVGDGINDAPVLTRADAGIAMGGLGSDAAIEAADAVIMDDDLQKIPLAVRMARKTLRIVKQNIVFALGVKVVFLALGAGGLMTMWGAVFADVGVALLAVANALRAYRA